MLDELLHVGKERLRERYGDRLRGVILHGSEARGEADEDSDVDLLVLLEGPVELGRELRTIIDVLYPLQLELGFFRTLEIIPTDVEDYEAQSYALYRHAREEGIRL
ncbi:MAG: nucleotidyltransferase domain-containing protein [Deltaproteobacteria bacterium]|nr:nucleotidyltransferase domain-containing protein [Deltaproteobacteria bacterium]